MGKKELPFFGVCVMIRQANRERITMIKDNQTLLNRIHVVVDALVIACTYIAAWFIQFEFFAPDVAGKLPLETYMSALVILIPGLLLPNSSLRPCTRFGVYRLNA